MLTTIAARLKIGDVFTTQADQGEVWFRVIEIVPSKEMLDVLGEVIACNPDVDYSVGDSEWMDLGNDEEVVVRI